MEEFSTLLRDRLELSVPDEQLATLHEGYILLVAMLANLREEMPRTVEPALRFSVDLAS
ncbi:hypothetical protein SAMN05216338_10095 [Bradyrhizobium sp. Rc2d]|nr:hypothetical protein SAMN05216338_10095 [Bradyrhizobium sp. Rc2d]